MAVYQENDMFLGKTWATEPVLELRGKIYRRSDRNYAAAQPYPWITGGEFVCRLVKNNSGGALGPSLCVKYGTTDGDMNKNIGGLCGAGDVCHGITDPYLPSTGVPNQYYFFIIEPRTQSPMKFTSDGSTTLAPGDILVTAASGKVKKQTAAPADTTAAMVQVKSVVCISDSTVTNVDGTVGRGRTM